MDDWLVREFTFLRKRRRDAAAINFETAIALRDWNDSPVEFRRETAVDDQFFLRLACVSPASNSPEREGVRPA
jgi:hypothetical protein